VLEFSKLVITIAVQTIEDKGISWDLLYESGR